MQAIAGRFLIHKEPPGRQMVPADLERILSLPRSAWASGADPANRASSFVPVTMWMLAVVENPTTVALERWLMLRSWRLWDARLFAIDADSGKILASCETGQRVPMAERVIQRPEATFPLVLEPRERVLLVLRIEDKSFAVVGAYLVDPDHQVQRAERLDAVSIALLGFLTAIALMLLAQGEWRFAAIAAWLMATAVFEFSFQVPLLQTLLPFLAQYSITIFTTSGSLGMAAFALMTLSFLGLQRNRFWIVVYGLCVAVLLACSLAIPWVDEHQIVRKVAATTALFLMLSWPLAAWTGRGMLAKPYSRLLWVLFAVCWGFYTVRVLMFNGLLNVDLESHPMVLLYLSGLVAFSLGALGVDSRIRKDAAARLQRELDSREEGEQQRMLSRQREEAARLTAEVERQTEALRKANAQALASSDAKSKFLSSASHELRAPLHDLLGYAQLLAREIPAGAQAHLAVIQKSGRQLLQLIDDILEFSRGEAKPMALEEAPVSLHALAAHLQATCAPAAARGGNRFQTRVHLGAADWVIADERRLTQVLRNLIDNACKFTRDGVIELGIETVDAAGTAGEPEGADEPLVRFSVRDTGVGIPADQHEAIFEAFKRLDRYNRAPGLGLGLAICRQIVTACGGRLRVQSRQGPDAGSLFSFELRLRLAESGSEAAGSDSPRAILGYRGRPRTVLIVDDRASSRRLLADRCELLGLEVLEAADGRDALNLLNKRETQPDLALVDQFMPELDGWGFLRRVRAAGQHRDLPVVLISAAPLERPDGFPAGVGFDEVALKPLSATALTDILQRHLDLEWEYAETDLPAHEVISTREPDPSELSLPPGCCDLQLAELEEMLALGAVVAIEQWAVEMAEAFPEHDALWDEIRQRANRVDLVGLRDLVARLRPTISGAERAEEAC
jgi:signal transduction histidine kinase/DNA-binding response OmpR family regulator